MLDVTAPAVAGNAQARSIGQVWDGPVTRPAAPHGAAPPDLATARPSAAQWAGDPCRPMPDDPWYCVRHRHGEGATARFGLRRAGCEVHWPRLVIRRPRHDDQLTPLFPGYLFVRPGRVPLAHVLAASAVLRVLGHEAGRPPTPVPDAVVEHLLARAGGAMDGTIDETPDAVALFRSGQAVRVASGPLEGLRGLMAADRGADRVRVLLSVLGGQREVSVARCAVEAV